MLLTKPRGDQREAVRGALAHHGFAVFCEQRVGKTLIALAVADKRKPDILVVVCPKKALRVWRTQLKKHIRFDWDCTKIVIHYEGMCRNAKDRRYWRKMFREKWLDKKVMLIVDEGHRIKSRGSLQSSMLRSVGPYADYRLLLTGTPGDKIYEDAWAIFDFVKPGALEWSWDEYSDRYLIIKKEKGKGRGPRSFYAKIVGVRNKKRFNRIFHRYSYRITLREAQERAGRRAYILKRRVVRFELKPDTRRVYNELLSELKTVVRKKIVSTPLVVTLVSKLQQLTGGFLIHSEPVFDKDDLPVLKANGKPKVIKSIIPVGREKLIELTKILRGYPKRKKIVICVQYTHEIERIGRQLEKLGRSWKQVSGQEDFDGEFDTDTIILQIRSGEAIDLARARLFIMYSWDYSNISHSQASFRILSFKSKRVDYIYLIANDSVDDDIYGTVRHKGKSIAKVMVDKLRKRG